jgi:hypothetical protein
MLVYVGSSGLALHLAYLAYEAVWKTCCLLIAASRDIPACRLYFLQLVWETSTCYYLEYFWVEGTVDVGETVFFGRKDGQLQHFSFFLLHNVDEHSTGKVSPVFIPPVLCAYLRALCRTRSQPSRNPSSTHSPPPSPNKGSTGDDPAMPTASGHVKVFWDKVVWCGDKWFGSGERNPSSTHSPPSSPNEGSTEDDPATPTESGHAKVFWGKWFGSGEKTQSLVFVDTVIVYNNY